MRPSQTILVLEDLRKISSGPLYRKGVALSANDSQTVFDVYQQWLLLSLDLGYLHHVSLERVARRLWSDMTKMDVLDLNNAFADLLSLIRLQKNKGFKALCARISSHLYSLLKDDFELILTGDVYAAKRLIQLFSYTSRLTLTDIDLAQQCLDDYMAIEDEMSTYRPRMILKSLNEIIKRWMTSFDPDQIHFGHGPGGVAGHGRTALQVKYNDLTSDALTDYVFGEPHWVQSPIPSRLDRISETIFVPKSYKTFRTISMEPSTLMYLQQGVLKEITRVIYSSKKLKIHIGPRDQERNQLLAREGSINRKYATIDLSAASDSVSYSLVKEVFKGTKLLPYLVATRSPRTLLPDGRLIKLKKFAPMGSALCFPIETIIFAAICQYVTREHNVLDDYSVYGDDIIVPTQCAQDVMNTLNILGFAVNDGKSFYDPQCWFRESCGGEYCDGFDVSPMRISRKYHNNLQDVKLTSLVDLANAAYEKGFRNLRYFFILKLRNKKVRFPEPRTKLVANASYVLFFSPTNVHGDNYTNYHTERRWNHDLQRIEAKATSFSTRFVKIGDETTRLRHWFEATHNRFTVGDGFQSHIGKSIVLPKNRWLEKPYEWLDQPFINFFTTKG